MGKIWLKGPDPLGQCCGCEGKTSPCSSCCVLYIPNTFIDNTSVPYDNVTDAQEAFQKQVTDCIIEEYATSKEYYNSLITYSKTPTSILIQNTLSDELFVNGCSAVNNPNSGSVTSISNYTDPLAKVPLLSIQGTFQLTPSTMNNDGTWNYIVGVFGSVLQGGTLAEIYLFDARNLRKYYNGDTIILRGCDSILFGGSFPYSIVAEAQRTESPFVRPYSLDLSLTIQPSFAGRRSSTNNFFIFKISVEEGSTFNLNVNYTANDYNNSFSSFIFEIYDDSNNLIYDYNILNATSPINNTVSFTIENTGNYYFTFNTDTYKTYALQKITSTLNSTISIVGVNKKINEPCQIIAKYYDGIEETELTCP